MNATNKKVAKSVILLLIYLQYIKTELVSPCPGLFEYENNDIKENKLYARVTLIYRENLSGIWLRMFFDRPVISIGVS